MPLLNLAPSFILWSHWLLSLLSLEKQNLNWRLKWMSSGSWILSPAHHSQCYLLSWSGADGCTTWNGRPYCFKGCEEVPCSISILDLKEESLMSPSSLVIPQVLHTHTWSLFVPLALSISLSLPLCLFLDRNDNSLIS